MTNQPAKTHRSALLPQGVIVEMVKQGIYVKVSAIDPVSGEEAFIIGDPKAPQNYLSELAIRKLEQRLTGLKPSQVTDDGNPMTKNKKKGLLF